MTPLAGVSGPRGPAVMRVTARWLLAAALLPVAWAPADDLAPYQSLLENSPFLTQAFRDQLGRRDRAAIYFLGYTRIGEEWHFALFDGKADKNYWLTENEEEDNIRVEQFNRRSERLHVNVDGISFELRLHKD